MRGVLEGVAGAEKMVSAAKQVASSTAQLLVVCKVKVPPGSPVMKELQVVWVDGWRG